MIIDHSMVYILLPLKLSSNDFDMYSFEEIMYVGDVS